jgi:AraC-like DNA-binding protein
VLETREVFAGSGVQITEVACRHEPPVGIAEETAAHAIVFVRRGSFVRSASGVERFLDSSSVFFVNPGQQQRCDHPDGGGDDCTAFLVAPELLASLWGGDPALPVEPVHSHDTIDLAHGLLLAAARRGEDPELLAENAIALLTRALQRADSRRVQSGRPPRERMRRLVDEARAALVCDPEQSLPVLAQRLAISPHHLSRSFKAATGQTIAGYRMRLRARTALERMADGERNLADLAADLGFADHSHLCRVIRATAGTSPSLVRAALGSGQAGLKSAGRARSPLLSHVFPGVTVMRP